MTPPQQLSNIRMGKHVDMVYIIQYIALIMFNRLPVGQPMEMAAKEGRTRHTRYLPQQRIDIQKLRTVIIHMRDVPHGNYSHGVTAAHIMVAFCKYCRDEYLAKQIKIRASYTRANS